MALTRALREQRIGADEFRAKVRRMRPIGGFRPLDDPRAVLASSASDGAKRHRLRVQGTEPSSPFATQPPGRYPVNADRALRGSAGARATERDHLTGCPAGTRTYLDPDVWVPCDRTCNLVNEHAWSAAGLLVAPAPLLVVRMKRFAYGTARFTTPRGPGGPPRLLGGGTPPRDRCVVALERLA